MILRVPFTAEVRVSSMSVMMPEAKFAPNHVKMWVWGRTGLRVPGLIIFRLDFQLLMQKWDKKMGPLFWCTKLQTCPRFQLSLFRCLIKGQLLDCAMQMFCAWHC